MKQAGIDEYKDQTDAEGAIEPVMTIYSQAATQILPDIQTDLPGLGSHGFVVIVHNNDYNTFDEVEQILIMATGCSRREAEMETWEVHNLGKSTVHQGSSEECERAASVIRTIGIHVEVRED